MPTAQSMNLVFELIFGRSIGTIIYQRKIFIKQRKSQKSLKQDTWQVVSNFFNLHFQNQKWNYLNVITDTALLWLVKSCWHLWCKKDYPILVFLFWANTLFKSKHFVSTELSCWFLRSNFEVTLTFSEIRWRIRV